MKVNNENFDKVLNKLVASTRSPRGRFTAENSWRLLESRLLKRRSMKRFWMRTASAAAVVLLCVTSWAAYQFLYVAPQREAIPTEAIHTTEETQVIHSVLTFDQQPLQEIVRQLSETFRTDIRIEGDSLKNYHMTATFREGESLTEILDLLKDAGNFTYKKENNTIILTTKLKLTMTSSTICSHHRIRTVLLMCVVLLSASLHAQAQNKETRINLNIRNATLESS